MPLETIDPGEGAHRCPRQPARRGHGAPERDEGGHRHRVGNAEQRAHLVLAAHGHGGHHAGEALGPRGQQQAPDERVDGGPAGEGVARQVAVDGGERGQVGEDEEEGGRGLERLGEAGCRGPGLGERRRVGDGRRLGRPVGHRRPGHQPGRHHGQVLVPPAEIQLTEGDAGRGVLHHDHPPALAVAAARREAGGVEQAGQHLVVDGLGVELPDGAGAAQRVDEVEVHGRPTVAGGGRGG